MPFPITMEPDMMDMEDELRISVVDVYDLASDIGKEFEKIIDRNGTDAVTGLMPMVISALEQMEKLATRNESTTSYIEELRATITQLQNEKIGKAEDRQKYERELEEIEDRLREESHELVAMVARLQDENRKLSSSLAKSEGTVIHSNGATPEVDLKVVTRLQEIIEAQREQIHKTEREHHLKSSELDNLKSQLEKVNHVNRELRRRQRINNNQMRSLIDERAELQAALQEETRAVTVLRQRLGLAQKENEDLASSSSDSLDLTNKLVFDRDDPNRPRFTMTELKEILYERNELKARVSDLEDELEMYRPKEERQRSHIICPPVEMLEAEGGLQPPTDPLTPPLSLSDSLSNEIQDAATEEEDPPVQGPMPYEPEDAPWKKEESGIRKFFVSKKCKMRRLKTTSEPLVSVDYLAIKREIQDPTPEKACSTLEDPEYLLNSDLHLMKYRADCMKHTENPYENKTRVISSSYFSKSAIGKFKTLEVLGHNKVEKYLSDKWFERFENNISVGDETYCLGSPKYSSNTITSYHNSESNDQFVAAGQNFVNIANSGTALHDHQKEFFDPMLRKRSEQHIPIHEKMMDNSKVLQKVKANKRKYLESIPQSISNWCRGKHDKDVPSSRQCFHESDLPYKSAINWNEYSCDEFLMLEFCFCKFYKPLLNFSSMH